MIQQIVDDRYLLEIVTRDFKHQALDWPRLVSLVSFMLVIGKRSNFPSAEVQVTERNARERRDYKVKMQVKMQRVEGTNKYYANVIKPAGEVFFYLFKESVMLSLENSREYLPTFYLIYILIYLSTLKVVFTGSGLEVSKIMEFVAPIK